MSHSKFGVSLQSHHPRFSGHASDSIAEAHQDHPTDRQAKQSDRQEGQRQRHQAQSWEAQWPVTRKKKKKKKQLAGGLKKKSDHQ